MNSKSAKHELTAPLFAALGDPIRLGMVSRLCAEGPLPTVQLQKGTNVSRQAITKHLCLLEENGLVTSERVARDRLWRVEVRQLNKIRGYLEQISAQWDAALERLRSFVEEPTDS